MAPLRVIVVYPELLGTYGDGGNGVVLAKRASWRGIDTTLIEATADQRLPEGDLYCLGGGEDAPQTEAAEILASDGMLGRSVANGAVVLAVCAGYQIIGRTFTDAHGVAHPGLGLLDVETKRGAGRRAVGELVAEPIGAGLDIPTLSGFENHAGLSVVGHGAQPLGRVRVGVGNGDGTEGAWSGRVVGTYCHGPVLARNPALADLLLGWALGVDTPLAPLGDHREELLRAERLRAASRFRSWRFRSH